MKSFITNSVDETENLGQKLAQTLEIGSVVALYGELGAGKTVFIRGLARGLGFTGRVTSPTFAIVNEYIEPSLGLVLVHFDLYRLESKDLFDVGWHDFLSSGVICAAEWAQNAGDEMPGDAISVYIVAVEEDKREIKIEGAKLW